MRNLRINICIKDPMCVYIYVYIVYIYIQERQYSRKSGLDTTAHKVLEGPCSLSICLSIGFN